MSLLHDAERLLSRMTLAEKAQVLQWVARDVADAYPGVENMPDVCGGSARLVGTRIPVWTLEQARRLGTPEAEILRAYPSLLAEDLVNAWSYVRGHLEEIEGEIRDNESA